MQGCRGEEPGSLRPGSLGQEGSPRWQEGSWGARVSARRCREDADLVRSPEHQSRGALWRTESLQGPTAWMAPFLGSRAPASLCTQRLGSVSLAPQWLPLGGLWLGAAHTGGGGQSVEVGGVRSPTGTRGCVPSLPPAGAGGWRFAEQVPFSLRTSSVLEFLCGLPNACSWGRASAVAPSSVGGGACSGGSAQGMPAVGHRWPRSEVGRAALCPELGLATLGPVLPAG